MHILDFKPHIKDIGYMIDYRQSALAFSQKHSHKFYEFIFVTQGSAYYFQQNESRIIKRGDLLLVKPEDIHLISPLTNSEFIFYNLAFTINEQLATVQYLGGDRNLANCWTENIIETEGDFSFILSQLIQINDYQDNNQINDFVINVKILHAYLLAKFLKNNISHNTTIKTKITNLVESYSRDENISKGVSYLYDNIHYNPSYFNREFKKIYNMTPSKLVLDLKLTKAHLLIISTDLPLATIAFDLGFGSQSYFSKKYKEKYNTSPKAIRET